MAGALLLSCVPPLLCVGATWLGVWLNTMAGFAIFMIGAFVMLACFVLTPLIAGIVLVRAPRLLLEVIWVRRDGSIGPWSGERAHVLCWFALWIPVATLGFALVLLNPRLFPTYPGGWP